MKLQELRLHFHLYSIHENRFLNKIYTNYKEMQYLSFSYLIRVAEVVDGHCYCYTFLNRDNRFAITDLKVETEDGRSNRKVEHWHSCWFPTFNFQFYC